MLLEGLCEPGPVYQHSKAGTGALIFSNRDHMIHNMIATTVWGTPTPDQLDRLPALPVISINRADGEYLKSLLVLGTVRVRVTTEVETGWFRSRLPEAVIPGNADPELFTLVGAHYCAWDVGVTDNATGDALLLEMARLLWERRSEVGRSVKLCWWPGHSHGRYSGSTWYADTFFAEISKGCILYHNIDSPGTRGATQYVCRHTTAEVQQFARAMIHEITGQADPAVHRPGRAGTHRGSTAVCWRSAGRCSPSCTARAFALPALVGNRNYGFVRTQAVRELNRLCVALDEATAATVAAKS